MSSTITVAAIQAAMTLCLVEMEYLYGRSEVGVTTRLELLSAEDVGMGAVQVVLSVKRTVPKAKIAEGGKILDRTPLEAETTIKFVVDTPVPSSGPKREWDWSNIRNLMWRAVTQAIQASEVDLTG